MFVLKHYFKAIIDKNAKLFCLYNPNRKGALESLHFLKQIERSPLFLKERNYYWNNNNNNISNLGENITLLFSNEIKLFFFQSDATRMKKKKV